MDVVRLSPEQVVDSSLRSLGLGAVGVGLFSPEALSAALRRGASFLCPTTPGALVRSVLETVDGLPGYGEETGEQLDLLLDALVGYGDLLELPAESDESAGRRLFLGPPAFVRRASGAYLLIGVRPDGASLVVEDLAAAIEYKGHTRLVNGPPELAGLLVASDLSERTPEQWLRGPRQRLADKLLTEYSDRLHASRAVGRYRRCPTPRSDSSR